MPPRSPARDVRIGALLHERYRITAKLGEGSMGVVYRGERLGLARPVAIKFLREGAAPAAELRRRFVIEAKAASKMSHPCCVPVIDYGVHDGAPFIVMPFVRGQSLRDVISAGTLSVPRALGIARQVLAGLAHAHEHGIVHRDLKPENILVWSDALGEHAQITDFGLAKIDASPYDNGIAIGTPSYMAPEQTRGLPVDIRADVYAAGVLLFELLADRKPFSNENPFVTMQMHRDAPVPAFDDVAPERCIPAPIEGVVRRALEKRPVDRYASAAELAHALEAAIADAQSESAEDPVDELLAASSAWRPGWVTRATVLIAGVLAVAAWTAY